MEGLVKSIKSRIKKNQEGTGTKQSKLPTKKQVFLHYHFIAVFIKQTIYGEKDDFSKKIPDIARKYALAQLKAKFDLNIVKEELQR